jgi:hypothetical protein
MPVDQDERPTFYQGQYLGPEDLTAAVDYGRIQVARHILGAHTLGIAIGLQLIEKPSAAGNNAVDVFLEPGYAWDGFGRVIVVLSPYKIPAALFQNIVYDGSIDNPKGHLVRIWLQYSENANQPPAAGFQVCDATGQTARVQETFSVQIGDLTNISDQRDPLSIGGKTVDALQALSTFDPAAKPVYDLSIPQQALPEDNADALWLIPVGFVRWLPGQTSIQAGAFQPRTAADLTTSDTVRQYIGVVAGSVEAPGSNVEIKARGTAPSTIPSADLLWVDGPTRVQGNVSLFGSQLIFKNQGGGDDGIPLLLQRATQQDQSTPPKTLTSLQIEIGTDNQGNNMLSVGPLSGVPQPNTPPPPMVQVLNVLDNGKVGVGTLTPQNPLGIRGSGGSEDLLSFEDASGHTKWQINQKANGVSGLNFAETGVADFRLFIQAGGKIGVGLQSPTNRLHVDDILGIRQKYLFMSGDQGWSSLTYNAYHDSANQNWVFPDPAHPAVTIEMDDQRAAGVARFEVWTTLSTAKTSWVQRMALNGDTGDVYLAHHGGNVGIGTTTPTAKLQVTGGIKWASSQLQEDQGGSIELGGDSTTPGSGIPHIDFHFSGLTQDFNTRIINDANGQLSFFAQSVRLSGDLIVNGARTYLLGLDGVNQHWIMAGGSTENVHNAIGLIFRGGNNNLFHTGPGWTKGFLINHPLDPDAKFLAHATLEGPEAAVFYRGEGQLSEGKAIVELPDYFESLAREEGRTVLLTPLSESDTPISQLATSSVDNGSFTVVGTDKKNPSQRFYWEVKAVRSDVGQLETVNKKAPQSPRNSISKRA